MATVCTQEAVLQFLTERGGKVKNQELVDYFKSVFTRDPEKKAAIRESFKEYVDNIAFVKIENGVKFVCLKKKYRCSVKCQEKDSGQETRKGIHAGATSVSEKGKDFLTEKSPSSKSDISESSVNTAMNAVSCGRVCVIENAVNEAPQQEKLPGSGYGTDDADKKHPKIPEIVVESQTREGVVYTGSVGILVAKSAVDMGNTNRKGDKKASPDEVDIRTRPPDIGLPHISVIEASPLPAPKDGTMFTLPGPSSEENTFGQVDTININSTSYSETDPNPDCVSLCESNTSKGSRNNFIELMMNSSPQVRRSMALRNSVYLSARYKDYARSDSDSVSQASSTTEDDGTSVTLDPLEHEWMMCSSDGEWGSLYQLLACEPNLILKKDFVSGFTCLHWAAKQGKPELLALIVNFAKKHSVPININTRSSAGYTPLHLAAMHNHVEVMKLLIGAYDADVEVRDYNGKKACQYLTSSVAEDIRDIIGVRGDSDSDTKDHVDGVRWRLSKVLQSNLMPLKLLNHNENDCGNESSQAKPKLLRRKSSLSKIRPRLQKIRFGTQIIHSTSFQEGEQSERSPRGSLKSRPKSTLFG